MGFVWEKKMGGARPIRRSRYFGNLMYVKVLQGKSGVSCGWVSVLDLVLRFHFILVYAEILLMWIF